MPISDQGAMCPHPVPSARTPETAFPSLDEHELPLPLDCDAENSLWLTSATVISTTVDPSDWPAWTDDGRWSCRQEGGDS